VSITFRTNFLNLTGLFGLPHYVKITRLGDCGKLGLIRAFEGFGFDSRWQPDHQPAVLERGVAVVTLFDFLTFFLGLFLVALGEFFMLAGGADSNFGLAIFAVLITIIGLGISMVRELTSENADQERDLRKIYGFICFLTGVAYLIIPVWQAATRLLNNSMSFAVALLLIFTMLVSLVFLFLGYSWVGAFDTNPVDYEENEPNPPTRRRTY
jgi:glucan phosphoethanolaminetransferase (alkaline phosphatase superfamily)